MGVSPGAGEEVDAVAVLEPLLGRVNDGSEQEWLEEAGAHETEVRLDVLACEQVAQAFVCRTIKHQVEDFALLLLK